MFLHDLEGNPNSLNSLRQTPLHSACEVSENQKCSTVLRDRKAAALKMLLGWRGGQGMRDTVDVDARQEKEKEEGKFFKGICYDQVV